jgi:dihydroxy-acid dehydratase
LSVDVSDEVLESRKSRWVKPPYKFTLGVLHKYIKCVATASQRCVTDN